MTCSPRPNHERDVREHLAALRLSSRLTSYYRRMHEHGALMVSPRDVINTLFRAGIRCVLMGTYELNGWRDQARATQDVDVLVTKRSFRKGVSSLHARFPKLRVSANQVMTRFVDVATGKGVIDVRAPLRPDLKLVFRYTISIGNKYRIPDLEMTLASKFAALIAPDREMAKQYLDAGDFLNVVHYNRVALDVPKLQRLTDRVRTGCGTRVRRIIEDFDAGRTIQLQAFLE